MTNGSKIQFSLGDKENSDMCDFTSCNYKCNPVTSIDDKDIELSTYNENFISINLDKIIQRIRFAFREKYIYKKTELIKHIRHLKNYPLDQIYSTLTFLINEKNEYITDILGRLGHLVNIGEYYMFQPIEIENKHISRYERTHPIDYKRKNLTFNLPDQILKLPTHKTIKGEKLKKQLLKNFNSLKNPTDISSTNKTNWIMHCAWAIRSLDMYNKDTINPDFSFNKNELLQYAINHIINSKSFDEQLELLNYITDKKELDELDNYIKHYFDKFILERGRYKGIILIDYNVSKGRSPIKILSKEDSKYIYNSRAIQSGLAQAATDKIQILDTTRYNKLIGFMINYKNDIVFKTKYVNMTSTGREPKGARCDRGEGKKAIIEKINKLLLLTKEGDKYKIKKNAKSKIESIYDDVQAIKQPTTIKKNVSIGTLQLCCEMELILRHYNSKKINKKIYFLSTISASYNNIEKLKKNN